MPVLTVLLVIIAVGVLLWAVHRFIPMDPTVSKILSAVVVIFLIVWLLQLAGVWDNLLAVKVR